LQAKVLNGAEPITCRPADLLAPEMAKMVAETQAKAAAEGITLSACVEEDALIDGMFAQVGWKFLVNRGHPEAFEPSPTLKPAAATATPKASTAVETYSVNVDGRTYNVSVGPGNSHISVQPAAPVSSASTSVASHGEVIESPLAGVILKLNAHVGSAVKAGDVVLIMEAMKMETEIRSKLSGTVSAIHVRQGDAVVVGDVLITL
jgi:oxaloacetate decarboxylase alpha subunit